MPRIAPARSPVLCGARPLISSATVPWPMEKTWKPPESVITGRSQRMKRCSPPSSPISSWPGVRNRWNVFPSTMSNPSSAASRTSSVFTTALVASGTNAGVATSPWASVSVPARAWPGPRVWIWKDTRAGSLDRPPPALTSRALGGRALEGLRLAAADRDLARLALLGLRDGDLEHPVLEPGGDRLGVDPLRQGQRALEGAGGALDPLEALLRGLPLERALAGDGERRVVELDAHLVLADAGEVEPEQEVVRALEHVHRRHPAAHGAAVAGRAVERRVEEAV